MVQIIHMELRAINDVMSIALDLDNNTVNFYKTTLHKEQSVLLMVITVWWRGHGQGGVTATFDVNFGQRI